MKKWICLKRMELLDDPFRTDFCQECWRIYMQAYYWEKGLFHGMKSYLACAADNIVNIKRFEELIEKWLEKDANG